MNAPESKSTFWDQFVTWASVICICAIVAAMAIPKINLSFNRARSTGSQNACVNNLRQIDGAISEWALENGKTNGTVVVESEIKAYIKLDAAGNIPGCPQGGKYTYGKVGDIPQVTCSLGTTVNPPHVLW